MRYGARIFVKGKEDVVVSKCILVIRAPRLRACLFGFQGAFRSLKAKETFRGFWLMRAVCFQKLAA
jgi:hypothetical protein